MGVSASWIGFRGVGVDALMAQLGGRICPSSCDARPPHLACAELSSGWTILSADSVDFTHGDRLARWSLKRQLVACQMDEDLGYSASFSYINGVPNWAIEHDRERGLYDLSTLGQLPEGFRDLKALILAEQAAEGGTEAVVDCIFDLPLMLAESLTYFRLGGENFWIEPPCFTGVVLDTLPSKPNEGAERGELGRQSARMDGAGRSGLVPQLQKLYRYWI